MSSNPSLPEFVWDYIRTHEFCSKAVIAGKYVDIFGIQLNRGMEKTKKHKALMRRVASMFTVMKVLGIASRFSNKTVRINRGVFNAFTLQDVLSYKKGDCISQKSISLII